MKSSQTFAPAPETPGDVLRERLERFGITQDDLAEALKVSRLSVNQLVNNRRTVTAEMALRLGRVLGTSPGLWLNLQQAVDLFDASMRLGDELETLDVLRPAPKRSSKG